MKMSSTKDQPVLIHTQTHTFLAYLHTSAAPNTSRAFLSLLPFTAQHIHVRWSGEAIWIPQGDRDFGLKFENHTSHPGVGELLWYPGGHSETEILLPYGGCSFSSKVGQLAANHFMSIVDGRDREGSQLPSGWKAALRDTGVRSLWEGKQEIKYELASEASMRAAGFVTTPPQPLIDREKDARARL